MNNEMDVVTLSFITPFDEEGKNKFLDLRLELSDVDLAGRKLTEKYVKLSLVKGVMGCPKKTSTISFPIDKFFLKHVERMLKRAEAS